ncbi:cadherin-like domain-containing protein [Vibrio navarrensis]|uniref:cadherin-like domain-containing protein n=1 Tax=Vibrio navarrensis TaxID=29495 RepID=UPI003082199C
MLPDGDSANVKVTVNARCINGVALTGNAQDIAVDNGTVVIAADGAMTFEPAADFNGEINFGYQVKDADGDVRPARPWSSRRMR